MRVMRVDMRDSSANQSGPCTTRAFKGFDMSDWFIVVGNMKILDFVQTLDKLMLRAFA